MWFSLLQGDYTAAVASLETCLSVLTRALPSTKLDLVCSLSWNVIRYCLHRPTPLGWLVHQVGGKHEGEEARTSARDAALVYHQLSQLQLTGKRLGCTDRNPADGFVLFTRVDMMRRYIICFLFVSTGKLPQRSSLWALSLSLSAVNLSVSAQGKMAPTQLAQIYVTAAIALRTALGHHLSCLPVSVSPLKSSLLMFGFARTLSCFEPRLSLRVTCWAVLRVLPTNQKPRRSPTACAGSSLHLGGSSSWAVIGQWSQKTAMGCTLLRETQVCCKCWGCSLSFL